MTVKPPVFLDDPTVGELEKSFLCKAIDSTYISTAGPFIQEFEDQFASFLNISEAISTQSGTAALHMALIEAGIQPGDEVIVPALTFVASINPILYLGANPVFVDSDPVTWNINAHRIEEMVSPKTKAILPVHLYGNPCAMTEILKIAKEYHLVVIEDATESLGATYRGKPTGTLGEFGCFSFNGNKLMTTGGGGMVIGKENKQIQHIRYLVNQARDVPSSEYHSEVGYNYRMTNLEAALGLAQLQQVPHFLEKKKQFHQIYHDYFHESGSFFLQKSNSDASSAYWLNAGSLKNKEVSEVQLRLSQNGIRTRRVFHPIPEMPPYRQFRSTDIPVAKQLYKTSFCLPSSTLNSEESIHRVCHILKGILDE